MTLETIDAIVGISFLAIVFGVFYGPWQSLVTEYSRQRLFEIRDRLFDLAYRNPETFGFQSEEYKLLRNSINGSIRFCHSLTFWWMLFARYLLRNKRPKHMLRDIISKIPDKVVGDKIEGLFFEIGIAITLQMIFRSLPLFVLIWVMAPFILAFSIMERKQIAARLIEPIEDEVIRSGYAEYIERQVLRAA